MMSHLRGVEFDGMLPSRLAAISPGLRTFARAVFAHAQSVTLDTPPPRSRRNNSARLMSTTNRIGGGILVEPTYPGGNGLRSLPLPDVD